MQFVLSLRLFVNVYFSPCKSTPESLKFNLFCRKKDNDAASTGKCKLYGSEIGIHGKSELFHEYLLESADVILFVKDEHGFLIVDRVYRPE